MVNSAWLEANSIYDTPSRIAESGTAWGDDKDPEDIEEAHRKKAKEEKEEARRKRPRIDGGELVMVKKRKGKGKAAMREQE